MVRITGNLQPASQQPAGMMACVFGGAKLTPVLRTPEANPFADTEPMGKYRRSARAGWLYPTTHRAQHCFLQRSFPVMISLLNLYGSVSTSQRYGGSAGLLSSVINTMRKRWGYLGATSAGPSGELRSHSAAASCARALARAAGRRPLATDDSGHLSSVYL